MSDTEEYLEVTKIPINATALPAPIKCNVFTTWHTEDGLVGYAQLQDHKDNDIKAVFYDLWINIWNKLSPGVDIVIHAARLVPNTCRPRTEHKLQLVFDNDPEVAASLDILAPGLALPLHYETSSLGIYRRQRNRPRSATARVPAPALTPAPASAEPLAPQAHPVRRSSAEMMQSLARKRRGRAQKPPPSEAEGETPQQDAPLASDMPGTESAALPSKAPGAPRVTPTAPAAGLPESPSPASPSPSARPPAQILVPVTALPMPPRSVPAPVSVTVPRTLARPALSRATPRRASAPPTPRSDPERTQTARRNSDTGPGPGRASGAKRSAPRPSASRKRVRADEIQDVSSDDDRPPRPSNYRQPHDKAIRRYEYVAIDDLLRNPPPAEPVFLYGVIRDLTVPRQSRGQDMMIALSLVDPSSALESLGVNLFFRKLDDLAPLAPGDIVRMHRLKIQTYNTRTQGLGMVGRQGFSLLRFSGQPGDAITVTDRAHEHTFVGDDMEHIQMLRKWAPTAWEAYRQEPILRDPLRHSLDQLAEFDASFNDPVNLVAKVESVGARGIHVMECAESRTHTRCTIHVPVRMLPIMQRWVRAGQWIRFIKLQVDHLPRGEFSDGLPFRLMVVPFRTVCYTTHPCYPYIYFARGKRPFNIEREAPAAAPNAASDAAPTATDAAPAPIPSPDVPLTFLTKDPKRAPVTIREVLDHTRPAIFYVKARVTGIFPRSVAEISRAQCPRCVATLPVQREAVECRKCGWSIAEGRDSIVSYQYLLRLTLADDSGSLEAYLGKASAAAFFHPIPASDLHTNNVSFNFVTTKLGALCASPARHPFCLFSKHAPDGGGGWRYEIFSTALS